MIDLFTAATPNGWKVSICLEELGMPYEVKAIDLQSGNQKAPSYLALNPNGRIPRIVDREAGNFAVFESGAILVYLAEKAGRFLLAKWAGVEMEGFTHLQRWLEVVGKRPAVQKGSAIPAPWSVREEDAGSIAELARKILA